VIFNESLSKKFSLVSSALRYTLPNGEQKFVNITGINDTEMVHFMTPEEYFFGTKNFNSSCEQGGIYNRNMVSVRIEEYPPEKIEDMDHYFKKLQRKSRENTSKFSIFLSPIYNYLSHWLPTHIAERGNCARWISVGLVEAEVLRFSSLFPKKFL